MRRYLLPAFALVFVALLSFGVGLHAGIRKTPVFEFVVKTMRTLKPQKTVEAAPKMHLNMSDRALLDSALLPMHQREIKVTNDEGKPLPLLALAPAGGDEAFILGGNGTLFHLATDTCAAPDCLRQVGRLVRPDGTALDDIYDLLSVEIDGKREWFVSYGQMGDKGFTKALVISRFTPPARPGENDILRIEPPFFTTDSFSLRRGHSARSAGGAMVYDPRTDEIVITVGDYSLNGIGNVFSGSVPPPQSPDTDLGKILRVSRTTGESRIISMGHRNPQGLSISKDGELIATEHGPKGGDEINLIEEGKNYGWPYTSMGTLYNGYTFPEQPATPGAVHGGYTPPIVAFMPNPGLSALIHVEGFHPAWDGDLMVTSLRGQSLLRVRRWETGNYVEPIYIGDRIRDIDIIGKQMVLVTDGGKIIMLKPVENLQMASSDTGLINNLTALEGCGACHNVISPNSTNTAPYLLNIVGRQIASASDFTRYSEGLLAKGAQQWDLESLEQFLRSPQDFAPGTAMPDPELSDSEIAELMTLLPLLR
ncbi:PQQ-dependent sugar dehydrogenase [Paracoccus sp. S1E-3]|uniref:PQQ-dependent sugar dehydrogenase n=1 Tax=Paracoccus sp. S1E-3 TaxID=2756130 RepID=UPI0015EF0E20|nr:PQQ-dependent sugar dehydrogenase [Paracoccus sp. S1E-3]MBA4490584.1 PQQ-dependent sugar dehydrogenase [Paracoccus sp. S1E-3]